MGAGEQLRQHVHPYTIHKFPKPLPWLVVLPELLTTTPFRGVAAPPAEYAAAGVNGCQCECHPAERK
jgi:hypothetical protein